MNHLKQIAEKLPEYGLDAMLITSEAGERYAIGFHGEGLLLITREETHYTTDGRYIEAAQEQVQIYPSMQSPDRRWLLWEVQERERLP